MSQVVYEDVVRPLVKKRRKQEKQEPLEFDPSKVTDVKAEDLELDLESARYKAQHGQGGDRRA